MNLNKKINFFKSLKWIYTLNVYQRPANRSTNSYYLHYVWSLFLTQKKLAAVY
ncbi:hypothetical protein ABID22_001592 [Pontibacter aydingkolensis]